MANFTKLKDIWNDAKNYRGEPVGIKGNATPLGGALQGAWNAVKPSDFTPGFSLGINDFLTGYNPNAGSGGANASGVGAAVAQSGMGAVDSGRVAGDYVDPQLIDLGTFNSGGGGGGGGTNTAQYDQLAAQVRAQQEELANKERGNIESRRDALTGEIEGGYTDQMNYLDTQTQGIQNNAELGRGRIQAQKEGTINKSMQDAESAARMSRDTYRDLIIQGRRRARATGGGQSSGYLEITGMLDNQLMRGLGQVEQTKQGQVGAANGIADQAVGEIENTLQQVLGEIANNRAVSLRERDSKINEAKMNAADALLEVDKWVTQVFSDIETAKLSMKTGGGGGSSASFDKQGYAQAQSQNQQTLLNDFNNKFYDAQSKGYDTDYGQRLFNNLATGLMGQGAKMSDINTLRGMYFGNDKAPTNEFDFYQKDPQGWNQWKTDQSKYINDSLE